MAITMRVSLPGYNALTESNIYRYSLYADSDNVLIKEKARGSGTCALNDTAEITHSLGYIPFYLVYVQVSATRYRLCTAYDIVSPDWYVWCDSTKLYITNAYDNSFDTYKYYIFYDNLT